tara:strand:- start:28 stop:501 length:474 start_codon:yes stop_codon:yes gene_type:complete
MLSTHFTLSRAIKSRTAIEQGIDNMPSPDVIEVMKTTALNILEPVRTYYDIPIIPSSFYRGPKLEVEICRRSIEKQLASGKVKTIEEYIAKKQHPKGQAVDFEVGTVDNEDLFQWCNSNLDFDQLILEFYKPADPCSGWVHGSYVSPERNRHMILRY